MGAKESKIIGNGLWGNVREGLTKEEDDRYDELYKKLRTSKSEKNIKKIEEELKILEDKIDLYNKNKMKKEQDYKKELNDFIDEYYPGEEGELIKKGYRETLEGYLKKVLKNKDEEIKKWGSVYGAVYEKMVNRQTRDTPDERYLRLIVKGYKELDDISKEKVFDKMIEVSNDFLDKLHKKIEAYRNKVEWRKKEENIYYRASFEYGNKITNLQNIIKQQKEDYPKTKKAQLKADERIKVNEEELKELIMRSNKANEILDIEETIDNIIYGIKKFNNIDDIEIVSNLLDKKGTLSMFGDEKHKNDIKEYIKSLSKPKKTTKEDILKLINEIESSIIPRTDNKDIKKGTKMLKKIEKKLKQQQPEQEQEIPDQLRNFQYYIDKKRLEAENNYNKSLKDEDAKEDYDDDIREIKMDVKEYFDSYPELKKYVQIYNPFNKEESEEYVRQMKQKQQKKQPQLPQPKKETKKRVSKEDFQKLIDEIESSLIPSEARALKEENQDIIQGNMLIKQLEEKLGTKKDEKILKEIKPILDAKLTPENYSDVWKKLMVVRKKYNKNKYISNIIEDKYNELVDFEYELDEEYDEEPEIPQPKKETKKRVSKEDFQKLIDEIQSSLIQKKPDENLIEQGNEILQNIEEKLIDKYNKKTSDNNKNLMNINYKINDLQNLLLSKEEEEEKITAYKFKNAEYENKELNKKHKLLKKEIISIKKQIRENKKQMKQIKKENKVITKTKPKETPLKVKSPGRQGYLRAIMEQKGEKAFLKQLNYYRNETPYTKMDDKTYEDYLRMLEAYKESLSKKKLEKEQPKEKKPRGRPKKIINN